MLSTPHAIDITPLPQGGSLAKAPALPGGCFSLGKSPQQARKRAKDAVDCHMRGLLLRGAIFPTRSEIISSRRPPGFRRIALKKTYRGLSGEDFNVGSPQARFIELATSPHHVTLWNVETQEQITIPLDAFDVSIVSEQPDLDPVGKR
jgi:predicted RNase H-like HicB family nuclease